jgi:hypothetical protein
MSKRPVNLETKLPKGLHPSLENNELIINRFLKACSKESLVQYLYDFSAYTKRFDKPSVLERQRKLKYKRNAQKANLDFLADLNNDMLPKKKKKKVAKRAESAQ